MSIHSREPMHLSTNSSKVDTHTHAWGKREREKMLLVMSIVTEWQQLWDARRGRSHFWHALRQWEPKETRVENRKTRRIVASHSFFDKNQIKSDNRSSHRVRWPSGLRRGVKAAISSEAWVRTPLWSNFLFYEHTIKTIYWCLQNIWFWLHWLPGCIWACTLFCHDN